MSYLLCRIRVQRNAQPNENLEQNSFVQICIRRTSRWNRSVGGGVI